MKNSNMANTVISAKLKLLYFKTCIVNYRFALHLTNANKNFCFQDNQKLCLFLEWT